jgi:hypothetical protein
VPSFASLIWTRRSGPPRCRMPSATSFYSAADESRGRSCPTLPRTASCRISLGTGKAAHARLALGLARNLRHLFGSADRAAHAIGPAHRFEVGQALLIRCECFGNGRWRGSPAFAEMGVRRLPNLAGTAQSVSKFIGELVSVRYMRRLTRSSGN